MIKKVELISIPEFPIINEGDEIGKIIVAKACEQQIELRDGDIIVIAQKIVSIAEKCLINLDDVKISEEARNLALKTGRTPEECQIYIDESSEILEIAGKNVVVRHKIGYVCTSAGIDKSNIYNEGKRMVCLLPRNPDKSARDIRNEISEMMHVDIAVIICDTMGRKNRHGSISEAIGIAGISPLECGEKRDLYGKCVNPKIALIDRVASAASILMGEADEQNPVVIVRNVVFTEDNQADISKIIK